MEAVRIFWRGLRGRRELNFNWSAIDDDSTVLVAASEYRRDQANPEHSARFVGSAPITVRSVRPHGPLHDPNQGVSFVIDVDSPEPLDVVTDLVLLDSKPVEFVVRAILDADLYPFGFERLKVAPRPAVLFVADQAGRPPIAHTDAYLEQRIFGTTSPDELNFIYSQFGAEFWKLLPGPLPHITISATDLLLAADNDTVHLYVANVLEKLLRVTGAAAFRDLDHASDGNNTISGADVLFICIDNGSIDGGMNRFGTYTHPGGITFATDVAFVAHRAGLMTAAHELLHSFGAVDLYGHDGLNWGISLMGATAGGELDDTNFALPDPWHRMAMGMTRPLAIDFSARAEGSIAIDAVTFGDGWPAVLFWDSSYGHRDCFLVELRSQALRNGLRTLDRGVPEGFAVWQVRVNEDRGPFEVEAIPPAAEKDMSVNTLGKPDLKRGSISTWANGDATPNLTWIDGSPTRLSLTFTHNDDRTSGTVGWTRSD